MKHYLTLAIICLIISTIQLSAQGCSDAGFCSLQYHQQQNGKQTKNSLSFGNIIGAGDGNTFVNSTYIQYSRQLNNSLFWDTKFTANYISGALANHFNVGDVFTSISSTLAANKNKQTAIKILGGVKIPLTSANDKAGGKPLPMAYQTSLGTIDALLGILFITKKWEFTNAYQIPLMQQNKNSYFKEFSTTTDFPSTNQFNRKADILLRAAYSIQLPNAKWTLKPNLLGIYHVANDEYITILGNKATLENSKGLTLNANIISSHQLTKRTQLDISLATPLVVRTIRPDGLTRSFTAGIEYKILF